MQGTYFYDEAAIMNIKNAKKNHLSLSPPPPPPHPFIPLTALLHIFMALLQKLCSCTKVSFNLQMYTDWIFLV